MSRKETDKSGIERVRGRIEDKIRKSVQSVIAQEDLIAFLDLYEEECRFKGYQEGYNEAIKAIIEREDD